MTYWALGGRSIGGTIPLIVLTNCDEIDLHYRDAIAKGVKPDRDRYPHLPHPPVIVDIDDLNVTPEEVWGQEWVGAEIVGYVDGVEVERRALVADPLPTMLAVGADKSTLIADGQDCTRVVARALDQAGNRLPFLSATIKISATGPASIVGPREIPFRRGAAIFWVKSKRDAGVVDISISCNRFDDRSIALDVVPTKATA